MLRYIVKRFLMGLVTLWAVITITFVIMHTIPGNPFSKEGKMPPGVYNNLMRHYNLDKPKSEQYVLYLKNLAKLDLGPSITNKTRTVNDYIKDNFPVSLQLAVVALIFATVFGILLGIIAALRRNGWPDYLCTIIAIIGISVPSFIMSTVMIDVFAVKLHLVPTSGWGKLENRILPTIALSLMPLAYIARMMRSSMIEVMGQDYIKTAKAKGLSSTQVVLKHALRNAIIPVTTVVGITAANMVVGSFIIEKIFRIPGLGKYFTQSVFNRDYPVILGTTIFYSAILIFMNFIVDILYVIIDPRIRYENAKKKKRKGKENTVSDWGLEDE
ncbi:MAG: ABC transporter permease [Cellulosilyticaceae bacterium]